MSADNGIYVLKTKDNQYRVIHAQAIENLYYSPIASYKDRDLVSTRILEYYGHTRYTKDFTKAIQVANAIYKNTSYVEYGIQIFESNKTWNQIINEGRVIAKLELEKLKDDNSSWGTYQREKLERIISKYN